MKIAEALDKLAPFKDTIPYAQGYIVTMEEPDERRSMLLALEDFSPLDAFYPRWLLIISLVGRTRSSALIILPDVPLVKVSSVISTCLLFHFLDVR